MDETHVENFKLVLKLRGTQLNYGITREKKIKEEIRRKGEKIRRQQWIRRAGSEEVRQKAEAEVGRGKGQGRGREEAGERQGRGKRADRER